MRRRRYTLIFAANLRATDNHFVPLSVARTSDPLKLRFWLQQRQVGEIRTCLPGSGPELCKRKKGFPAVDVLDGLQVRQSPLLQTITGLPG